MAIHAWRMTLRPAARLAVVPRTVRAYATQRTSKMSFVSKLFSEPVIETIVVASRIARILHAPLNVRAFTHSCGDSFDSRSLHVRYFVLDKLSVDDFCLISQK